MASKKSKASAKSFVFVGLMLASLIVSVVGLFLSFATTESFKNILTGKTESFTIGLFSLESTAGVFTIIFAILAVVLALALIGVTLYTSLTGKKAKVLTLVLIIAALIASVLFLVLSFVSCAELTPEIVSGITDKKAYTLAVGAYLTFFGTVLVPFFAIANKLVK